MYRKSLLFALFLAGVAAVLTVELPHFMTLNPVLFVLLLPGVLASISAAGHVHSYRAWLAALVNAFLWFVLSAMLGVVFQWTLKRLSRRDYRMPDPESSAFPAGTSSEQRPERSAPGKFRRN
jgi:hypothetical protein